MSRSFLVESLLTTDDVRRASSSSSSISSIDSQYSQCTSVSYLWSTPCNQLELSETTGRHDSRSAATIDCGVAETPSQCDQQRQYDRLTEYDSRWSALFSRRRSTDHRHRQVGVADVQQLQRLTAAAAAVHTSLLMARSSAATTRGRRRHGSVVTHHCNSVCTRESLKLLDDSCTHQQFNDDDRIQQQQQQQQASIGLSVVSSPALHASNDNNELTRQQQTGQQTALYVLVRNSVTEYYHKLNLVFVAEKITSVNVILKKVNVLLVALIGCLAHPACLQIFGGELGKLIYPTFIYHIVIPQRIGGPQRRWAR